MPSLRPCLLAVSLASGSFATALHATGPKDLVAIHDAAGVLCGLTDASPGDGAVSALVTLPDDSYTLVAGANGSGESAYGSATAGPIPVTLDTCP